eukprot:Pgem_evm1s567
MKDFVQETKNYFKTRSEFITTEAIERMVAKQTGDRIITPESIHRTAKPIFADRECLNDLQSEANKKLSKAGCHDLVQNREEALLWQSRNRKARYIKKKLHQLHGEERKAFVEAEARK